MIVVFAIIDSYNGLEKVSVSPSAVRWEAAMRPRRKSFPVLLLVLLLLPVLACETATLISAGAKAECEGRGGIWKQEADAEGEVTEWCELSSEGATQTASVTSVSPTDLSPSATPPPAAEAEAEVGCAVPTDSYTWSYLEVEQDSGTGGVACSARFVFKNSNAEPLNLVVYSAWDNGAMKFNGWKTYLVKPGATWEEQVSRTIYKDGDVTFSAVSRLMVIRDTQACRKLLAGGNEPIWEAQALTVDEFACPLAGP